MTGSTERLITEMVEDLEAVRPLPRLRSAFAIVLAVWATILGVVWLSRAGAAGARGLLQSPIYLASFAGLMAAALGGTLSALAAGQPGRARLELTGLVLAVLGLAAAAIACLVGMQQLGLATPIGPPGADTMCFRNSVVFSLLPAGVILSFVVRGWSTHPIRAALVALVAAGALGASVVHLSCDFFGARHMLLGHLSVPIVLAAIGLYPLAILLRRLRG